MSLLPEIYLVSEKLYYIRKRNGTCFFRCLSTEEAGNLLYYSDEISSDKDETSRTISKNYSRIIGYNATTKKFYLQLNATNEMFAVYDTERDIEIIYHHRCLGLLGDVFPLIEYDDWLAILINGSIKKIREVRAFEDCFAVGNHILIVPAWNSPTFFKPYKLSPDGETIACSYNELTEFVGDQITEQLNLDCDAFTRIIFEEPIPIPCRKDKVFTAAFIDELLKRYDPEENKSARIYDFINGIFKKHLPAEQELLDYYLLLADVSRKLADELGPIFITDQCYWRMYEASLDENFGEAIKHTDTLEALLLKGTEPGRKEHAKDLHKQRDKGFRIGCFQMTESGIKAIRSDLENSRIIGSNLVPADVQLPGIISYNLEQAFHEVGYSRILSEEEKDSVIKEFSLDSKVYRFYTDGRTTTD